VLPPEPKIREQDIRSKAPPASSAPAKEIQEPVRQANLPEMKQEPAPVGPTLADDSSMLAKITPGTPPQRAASLRLTEEGRKLLEAGDAAKALTRLEKTIVIDASNAYGYFYLAKAQFRLGRYKEASNFLDIAEARLGGEPYWVSEAYALRGDLLRATGQAQKAEANYQQALRLNAANRTASDGLSRMQSEAAASPK
jgi:tetratricopeptide (TPR) repeat protein